MLLRNCMDRMEVEGRDGVGEAIMLYRIICSPHWIMSVVAPASDPLICFVASL